MYNLVRESGSGYYIANTAALNEEEILAAADEILRQRMFRAVCFHIDGSSCVELRAFLQLRLATKLSECFACLFIDTRHRAIAYEELFHGTIDQTPVFPREVVRRSLHHNAYAVIFAHNHPSGNSEPSQADIRITGTLKAALNLVDVKVLDHFVVTLSDMTSMTDRGLV